MLEAVAEAPLLARARLLVVVAVVVVTDCVKALLVDVVFAVSPEYLAVRVWLPTARAVVAHVAVLALPVPARAMDEQPETAVGPSENETMPVGDVPLTVAVNATLLPQLDGFAELLTVVVVDVGPVP